MCNKFERMVAFRYLRARKKEGAISLIAVLAFLGITIGVATLIVVMSVMSGFRTELMERILGINSHITVKNSINAPLVEYETLEKILKNIKGVTGTSPLIRGQVLAIGNEVPTGADVRATSIENMKNKKLVSDNLVKGNIDDFKGNGLIIGINMAKQLGLAPGDDLQLISPKAKRTFLGTMPRMKTFKVIGVFEVGMYEYDSSTIFMPLDTAQLFFKFKDSVSGIELFTENIRTVDEIAQEIKKELGFGFKVIDWQQANKSFIDSLDVERVTMFFILSLIILIASINIFSSMIMLVTDKDKQTAILRTIGATRMSILKIFFLCGASIGLLGTISGLALGTGFALNIESIRQYIQEITGAELFNPLVYFLSSLPSDMRSEDVINVIIMSLTISLLAPIIPAYLASKRSPIDGIRYE